MKSRRPRSLGISLTPTIDSIVQRLAKYSGYSAGDHARGGIHSVMVAPVNRSQRHQSRIKEYAAIDPGAVPEHVLQSKGGCKRSGHMCAGKDAGVDSIAAQYPMIKMPDNRVDTGHILTGKYNPRRLGRPIGELHIAEK